MRTSIGRFSLVLGVLLFAACGGSASYDINAPGDGDGGGSDGSSGDGGKARDGAKGGDDAALAAPGTCSFHTSGAVNGDRKGAGFGRMNGGGNLIVECGMFDGAVGETLQLDVGNGTYQGPADYTIDPHGGGGVTFHIDNQLQFHAFGGGFSTVCKVTIASAPATSFAPPGSQIAGTFACVGLVSDALNDGGMAMVDLAEGAFNVVIR